MLISLWLADHLEKLFNHIWFTVRRETTLCARASVEVSFKEKRGCVLTGTVWYLTYIEW